MKAVLLRIVGLAASVIVVLWGAATLVFLAFRVIPGDPVSVMLGPLAQVSEEVKDGIRAELGLDRPPLEQYAAFIGQLARGDLGESYQLRMPVAEVKEVPVEDPEPGEGVWTMVRELPPKQRATSSSRRFTASTLG